MKRNGISLGAAAALSSLLTGCSTTRPQTAELLSAQPAVFQADEDTGSNNSAEVSSGAKDANPPVRTVGYQGDASEVELEAAPTDLIETAEPIAVAEVLEGEAEEGWTLQSLEQLALTRNPAIQQASAAAADAAGIRLQVGLRPNPTIGYSGDEIGNEGGGGQQGAFVSQTFVRGNKLEWNRRVIGHDVNAMNWLIATQRQRILTDTRLAFYEALTAQKRLQLAREFRVVASRGVSISQELVEAQVGARPDVLQSEIQLSEVDLTVQEAEFQYLAARNALAALAGVPDLGQQPLVGEFEIAGNPRELDATYSQIATTSPLLAAAQARVDRARANIQRQQVQPLPNITGQFGVAYDTRNGSELANVQVSLPVPIHNKNQGNIRAAQAEYCVAIENVERLRANIRLELARVMRDYQIAAATVQRYEQSILPKAEETLALIQEAQAAGEFDFLRVLTARRAYFDANLRYATALGELAQANARIDGLLLSGGLSEAVSYDVGDDLRGQALGGQ